VAMEAILRTRAAGRGMLMEKGPKNEEVEGDGVQVVRRGWLCSGLAGSDICMRDKSAPERAARAPSSWPPPARVA
jgi:hypothetical protein